MKEKEMKCMGIEKVGQENKINDRRKGKEKRGRGWEWGMKINEKK